MNERQLKQLVREHKEQFDLHARLRPNQFQNAFPKASGQLWSVIPDGSAVDLKHDDGTTSGVVNNGKWTSCDNVAAAHVAKLYHAGEASQPVRGPYLRPAALLGDAIEPELKSHSLFEMNFAVAVMGKSDQTDPLVHGDLVVAYEEQSSLAKNETGSYQTWNIWGLELQSDLIEYRDMLDNTRVVAGSSEQNSTRAMKQLLADLLGLGETADRWSGFSKANRRFRPRRGEVIKVRYDPGPPERWIPSLVVSPNEFNETTFNSVVVMQCDRKGGKSPCFESIGELPGFDGEWSVGLPLVRGISKASNDDKNVNKIAPLSSEGHFLPDELFQRIHKRMEYYYA